MNKLNAPVNFNRTLIITVVFFIAVIIIAILFLWPKYQELKITQKNIEQKKIELQTKEEYLLKLSEIQTELERYQEEFSKINSALPDDPSFPSLFNYLQKTFSETGLILEKIDSFSISSSQDLLDLKEAVFSIGVAGSYSSFKNFLSVLEKSARLIEVENISFSSSKKEEGVEELFVFNLKLKVYSY